MPRRVRQSLLAACLCCATAAVAQGPKTNDEVSPAYVLEVGDMLPHIVRLVGSKEFHRLCSDGALANYVRSRRGAWLDPKQARAGLALARPDIPKRVTLAISREAVLSTCKTIRIASLLEMVEGLREARTDVAAKQRQRFIAALKQLFLQPVALDVVLTLDMPTKAGARSVLHGFSAGLAEEYPEELSGIVMEKGETSTTVRFDPDKFFADKELVDAFCNSIADVSEELVKPVLKASRNWRVTLVSQAVDKQFRIRLTIAADPGQLPRFMARGKRERGQEPLFTLSWDHRPLREGVQRILSSWRAARKAMGSIHLNEDLTTSLDVLEQLDRYLESSTTAGSVRCSLDDGLRLTMVHEHSGPVPRLRDTGLFNLVPRHAEFVWVTNHMDLPRMFQNVLTTMDLGLAMGGEIATRLGTGSLASLGPVARSFRKALAPLSRMLDERGREGFKAGAALFVTTQGRAYDHGPSPGREIPALALVGRPADRNTSVLFTRAVGRAVASARRVDLDSIARRTSKDPALDVPVFSLTWKNHDDLGLHMFMIGEFLVITTSKALGLRIHKASQKRAARALTIDVASRRQDLTEIVETSGSRLLDLLRQGRNGLYTLVPPAERSRDILMDFQSLEIPLHLVGHIRSEALVQDNAVKTTTTIKSVLPWIVPLPDTEARLKALRDKLGEWSRNWAAVRATGKCRWRGEENTGFRFLFSREGNYRNEIDGQNGLLNTWNGKDSFTRFNRHGFVCRSGGEHLYGTWNFSQIMPGTWCRGIAGVEVRWCRDQDSGEEFFLFQRQGDHVAHGIYLDPETGLPREARALANDPRSFYESAALIYEDYRQIGTVWLPHVVRAPTRFVASDNFWVTAWEGVPDVEDGLFCQEPRDDHAPTFDASVDATMEMRQTKAGCFIVRARCDDRDPGWFVISISEPFTRFHVEKNNIVVSPWGPRGAEKIGTLRVGPAIFKDVPADGINLAHLEFEGQPVGGVLGTTVFKRLCTELDLSDQKMRVFPPGHWQDKVDQPWVDLSMNPRGFQVPARVDTHKGLFHIALTGGYEGIGVEIYPCFVETQRLLQGKGNFRWPQERYVLSTLKSLDVSGLHQTDARCAFTVSTETAGDIYGMAGHLFLNRLELARILIDGPGQRIALIPKEKE